MLDRGTFNVDLYNLTITEAQRLLKNKEIASTELTQAVLDRIAAARNQSGDLKAT